MSDNEFFTFREYMKKEDSPLTASMEDYMEMIYRLATGTGFTRIHDLAEALNVQPPSATKMVQKLAELSLVNYKKYGIIILSDKGVQTGKALLQRHQIVEEFLRMLGLTEGVHEETEKIEHTIRPETVSCLADFVSYSKAHPGVIKKFERYRKAKMKPD